MTDTPQSPSVNPDAPLTSFERRFCGIVLILTAYVAFWGLFFPQGLPVKLPGFAADFNAALPFNIAIPPLHARFIGGLYLAASVFLVYTVMAARTWREARIYFWMVAIWTGVLGLVSILHREIFDWSKTAVWAWWIAYLWFPLQAAWFIRRRPPAATGAGALHGRWFLGPVGLIFAALGLALFIEPAAVAAVWPWKLPPILGRIYSGPFLAIGIGGIQAAKELDPKVIRGYLLSTLTFAVAALAASLIHRQLFDFGRVSPWLWFGGLAAIVFGMLAELRHRPSPTRSL